MKELIISDSFIEKLYSYTLYLEDEKQEKYKKIKGGITYSAKTFESIKFLYEEVLLNEIDQWRDWQETAMIYVNDKEKIENATM